jgi:hypothetical protein
VSGEGQRPQLAGAVVIVLHAPAHGAATGHSGLPLGRLLAQWRGLAGYTQHSFADAVYYSRSTLANIETGRQRGLRQFWQRADDCLAAKGVLLSEFEGVAARRRLALLGGSPPRAIAPRTDVVCMTCHFRGTGKAVYMHLAQTGHPMVWPSARPRAEMAGGRT